MPRAAHPDRSASASETFVQNDDHDDMNKASTICLLSSLQPSPPLSPLANIVFFFRVIVPSRTRDGDWHHQAPPRTRRRRQHKEEHEKETKLLVSPVVLL
jgi:hypothetical protein